MAYIGDILNFRTDTIYNTLSIPVAAGALYGVFGILLNPMLASLAMTLSSLSVVFNSLRLGNTLKL